jgi:gas vesicle protein
MKRVLIAAAVAGLFFLAPARGQDTTTTSQQQEIDQLKKDNAETKKELADLKKAQADLATNSDQDAQDNDTQMKALKDEINKDRPGVEGLVIAGDAAVGYVDQRDTDSSFNADISPLILWQPPDSHLLVEAAVDFTIGGDGVTSQDTETTGLGVDLGDISYDICDYCTVGGGLFAVPFGQYHNHFDPPWINKFPDDPLAFDAIAPVSEVGFFAKGAIPSGTTKWTYDIYAANGPNLITNGVGNDGMLNFNDYTDLNNNKAFGGRIGFLPLPDMEMGYSAQFSEPNPDGFQRVHAFMQAADYHFKPLIKPLGGTFDFSTEWIWESVSSATYDPTGAQGIGPITFASYDQGGYMSLCYRATESDCKIMRNLEFCSRFDSLQTPVSAPGGEHESRWTMGIDYWVTPMCVVKTAYEIDKKEVGESQNSFIVQFGIAL